MRTKANIELDAGDKSFATGLLPELITALRRCRQGDLLAVISSEGGLGTDLEAWCRFTRNTLVDTTVEAGRTRGVIPCGEAPADVDPHRPVGSPLLALTNFHCKPHSGYSFLCFPPQNPKPG